MSVNSKMTAIANAIRGKTGGTNLLTLEQMATEIEGIEKNIPIEISTDAGMGEVLIAANVGKVYKFTGTSDTYINGDLYIVEDV